ncbi:MAG TPA: CBS domain-containing protein [Pirellulales bacterium]|jgi:CBS domain-containing protein|nr:CBS domain-containing protein [Pirellulales bacterium]
MDIELQVSTDTIEQAGPTEPLIVDPKATVRDVFRIMRAQLSGSVLICKDKKLLGIFTERDALRLMARGGNLDAPIESVMVEKPITIRPGASISQAILRMSSGGYRRLPIVDGTGWAAGVLQVSGIIHYLAELFPNTIYNLSPAAEPVTHEREGP